ncbi:MAG: transcription antitermination factor NusB [Acidimicrobiaceae bacterium]|nr:transcription antitermination factor NusB [Acidimicrobiaceae bacterium]
MPVSNRGTSVPGFGARREAREDALAVLYEAEIAGGSAFEALARRSVPPSDYAMELALGVDADRDGVDGLLRRHLVGWRLERLAVVDRTLARIAAWELVHHHDVPTGVVLSEAVALATQYCSAESPRFLNGVLRAVADEVRGQDSPA